MAMTAEERQWMIQFQAYIESKFRDHEKEMTQLLVILQTAETELKLLLPKAEAIATIAGEVVSDLHLTTASNVVALIQQLAKAVEGATPPTPAPVTPATDPNAASPTNPPAPAVDPVPVPPAPVATVVPPAPAPVAPAPVAPAPAPAPSVPGPSVPGPK